MVPIGGCRAAAAMAEVAHLKVPMEGTIGACDEILFVL
jgi:hypothetical protein